MTEPTYGSAEFHDAVQKQIVNTVMDRMGDKLDWAQVTPLLEAARLMCADDLRAGGVGLHALAERDGEWIDAEEAFVSVAALDRDEGGEWYCETYWLSDLVTAEGDPDHVRAAIRSLERTIARLNAWLESEKPEA